MSRVLNFYVDDSGTRSPNRKPLVFNPDFRDFFALGGVLVDEQDEASVRKAHDEFRSRWAINYPLHSVEIRHCSGNFTWLRRYTEEHLKFMRELTRVLTMVNIVGIACVIDRPGYDARYREKYGRRQWHLCQTAFSIVAERAAKYARHAGFKLRVLPERSCRADERRIERYYEALQTEGSPFERQSSSAYAPLAAEEFAETLHEIRFKSKSSPLGQIADLYLWPIALAGYQPDNRAYRALADAGRLMESRLAPEEMPICGSKYSCFELVQQYKRER